MLTRSRQDPTRFAQQLFQGLPAGGSLGGTALLVKGGAVSYVPKEESEKCLAVCID